MRFAIYGVGAIGGYFGARLAQAGEEVYFIARGENLAALQKSGLRLESTLGDCTLSPVQATSDPASIGPVDYVLLGVKTWQVPAAAIAIHPLIGPQTLVIPFQNGVEAPDLLANELGREHVAGGLAKIFSMLVEPGHIRQSGPIVSIAFGELDGQNTPRIQRLLEIFARCQGVKAEIPADIQAALWEKLVFIASYAGMGAVTRTPGGIFRSLPQTRQMLEAAMDEICQVAAARGIQLDPQAKTRSLGFVDAQPPQGTSSMQRDIMNGRPSELESLNGAVVRLGQQAGVPTPIHTFIYTSLLPQEKLARGEITAP